jgi:hypothetical protein
MNDSERTGETSYVSRMSMQVIIIADDNAASSE